MDPITITTIASFAVKYGIPATISIIELFQKENVTAAEVKAAFLAAHKTYEDYEALPVGSAIPALPKG